jgi:hypothetical protein
MSGSSYHRQVAGFVESPLSPHSARLCADAMPAVISCHHA